MDIIELNRENRIPNGIVHSKQEFSTIEKRAFYLIMNELNPILDSNIVDRNKTVVIENVREIIGNPNSKTFKEALQKLNTRQIKYIDEKNEIYDFIVPFPRITYENNTLTIVIFQEVLKDLLDIKKGFTRYQLDSALSLTSHHSQRIYEILSRWKDLHKKSFQLDNLKTMLNVETKYPKWTHFELYVLKVAQKELAEKTDISFTYTTKKKGRKVDVVDFTIFETQNISVLEDLPSQTKNEDDVRIITYLVELGITDTKIQNTIISKKKTEFWLWLAQYRKGILKISKSPSGHLLKSLGLV